MEEIIIKEVHRAIFFRKKKKIFSTLRMTLNGILSSLLIHPAILESQAHSFPSNTQPP